VIADFGMLGKLSGADVAGDAALLYTPQDCLIARLDVFPDREKALEAVGLEGVGGVAGERGDRASCLPGF
jgi:hypothetical protein